MYALCQMLGLQACIPVTNAGIMGMCPVPNAGITDVCPMPNARSTDVCPLPGFKNVNAGDKTRVFMLAWQAFYRPSLYPGSHSGTL